MHNGDIISGKRVPSLSFSEKRQKKCFAWHVYVPYLMETELWQLQMCS